MYFKELEGYQVYHNHIRLKENYILVQHSPLSVPVGMQSVYKAELDRLMQEDIITEVNPHAEWVNSTVPVTKPDGSIRLCLKQSNRKKPMVFQDIGQLFAIPLKSLCNKSKQCHIKILACNSRAAG